MGRQLQLIVLLGALAGCADGCAADARTVAGAPTEAPDAGAESSRGCVSDADCPEARFCDLGECAEPDGPFGAACDATQDAPQDARLSPCAAYLCAADRCRSCESAEACGGGDAVCRVRAGFPGKGCGRDVTPEAGPAPEPPPPAPPPGEPRV